jgi:DNA-binding transcriptional MerR regulator
MVKKPSHVGWVERPGCFGERLFKTPCPAHMVSETQPHADETLGHRQLLPDEFPKLAPITIDSDTVSVYNKAMNDQGQKLTIEDLAELVDVPVRTIRFYITEGLIPGPEGRGKATTYTEEHLLRLRLVRRLAEQRVPLTEIKAQTDPLTLAEVKALLQEQAAHEAELAQVAQDDSPRAYVAALLDQARSFKETPSRQTPRRSSKTRGMVIREPDIRPPTEVWQRHELAPGVELHVRQDAAARARSLIDALLRMARGQTGHDDE